MGTIYGDASCYDPEQHPAEDGKPVDPHAMNAATRHAPLGSKVRVRCTSRTTPAITVTVTGAAPYTPGRLIDLTPTAFKLLSGGSLAAGVLPVEVTTLP